MDQQQAQQYPLLINKYSSTSTTVQSDLQINNQNFQNSQIQNSQRTQINIQQQQLQQQQQSSQIQAQYSEFQTEPPKPSKKKEKTSKKDRKSKSEKKEKNNKVNLRSKHVNKYYKVIEEVGQGAYGRVYKAEYLKNNTLVALKKFESTNDDHNNNGFPITALREIKLLKQLDHQNILKLREIIVTKPSERNRFRGSTFMVLDYMNHDFSGLFKTKYSFPYPQIKNIMLQILQGVNYLHQQQICHRDLKIANILLNNDGVVKIGDFGLARHMPQEQQQYTFKVVTLWYRAPELLLGNKQYSTQIDMWSVGCILAEFLCGDNLLKGDGEARQIEKIFELCGSPSEEYWPGHKNLPLYKDLAPRQEYQNKLKEKVLFKNPNLDEVGLDLLEKLLQLNPDKRLTAVQALEHPFFKTQPFPEKISKLNKDECHEMTVGRNYKRKIHAPQNNNQYGTDYKNVNNIKGQNYYMQQSQSKFNYKDPFKQSSSSQKYQLNYNNGNNNNDDKKYQKSRDKEKEDVYSPSMLDNLNNNNNNGNNSSNNNRNIGFSNKKDNQKQQNSNTNENKGLSDLASLVAGVQIENQNTASGLEDLLSGSKRNGTANQNQNNQQYIPEPELFKKTKLN
ncbi:Protein kinase-like domain [Pseudocohnilembus persalinus]|uniref:Cyclin-dependent kinase 2 homolog n=1 Tax=Pseudocohnilembus persalinus TaxID=266149 RepID=A0A0V0R2Z7_PSEPJ|nr:Protein kinase-like domain [Pseudocohnilembus persalinus]|eukprot:KRX08882.1 Protein kinase-like domain [Pseudocohnilembus persalinus]